MATASELWLDTRPPAGLPLALASQRARANELTSDPLARGAIALLLVTALVGLALAAVGLLLTVVGDLREERGSLRISRRRARPPPISGGTSCCAHSLVGLLGLGGGVAAGAIVGALMVAGTSRRDRGPRECVTAACAQRSTERLVLLVLARARRLFRPPLRRRRRRRLR